MARPESFRVVCDGEGCQHILPGVYNSHTRATRDATRSGWSVDAFSELCPDCTEKRLRAIEARQNEESPRDITSGGSEP